MQTSATLRLARKIRFLHESKHLSYRTICDRTHLRILNASGEVDPGLAYRIERGYEPINAGTRKRIGLPPICPTCHRVIEAKHRHVPGEQQEEFMKWWKDLPKEERRTIIRDLWSSYQSQEKTE